MDSKTGSEDLLNQAASLIKPTVIVDLFIHSSGPFGGPFFVWGGSSEPREPPLATALLCMSGGQEFKPTLKTWLTHVQSARSPELHLASFPGSPEDMKKKVDSGEPGI